MLKVKFIIYLVMVKNMLQTCWFHGTISIGLYKHFVDHTLNAYLPLHFYRSSLIVPNCQFGMKSWGLIKSVPWADIDYNMITVLEHTAIPVQVLDLFKTSFIDGSPSTFLSPVWPKIPGEDCLLMIIKEIDGVPEQVYLLASGLDKWPWSLFWSAQ